MTDTTPRQRRHAARSLIAIAALVMAASPQAARPDALSIDMCKSAVPYVAETFKKVLEPIRRPRYCLAGDVNGDGKPDIFMVVKIKTGKVPAATGIKTIHPFWGNKDADKGRLQFLALHSTPNSAKGEWARHDRILLDGGSPILVLVYPSTESDLERVSPRSSWVKDLKVPRRQMRGDGVLTFTEAVHSILYWNGKTWVFHEDPEGP